MIAVSNASVDRPVSSERADCCPPQLLDMIIIAGLALVGELRRRSEPDAECRRKRPGTKTPLLPSSVDERRGLGALLHPQRANRLRSVDLVGRDRDQIWPLAEFHPP